MTPTELRRIARLEKRQLKIELYEARQMQKIELEKCRLRLLRNHRLKYSGNV